MFWVTNETLNEYHRYLCIRFKHASEKNDFKYNYLVYNGIVNNVKDHVYFNSLSMEDQLLVHTICLIVVPLSVYTASPFTQRSNLCTSSNESVPVRPLQHFHIYYDNNQALSIKKMSTKNSTTVPYTQWCYLSTLSDESGWWMCPLSTLLSAVRIDTTCM